MLNLEYITNMGQAGKPLVRKIPPIFNGDIEMLQSKMGRIRAVVYYAVLLLVS